jgi:glucans biosynthesis protein
VNRRLFLTTSITVPVVASFERAFAVGLGGAGLAEDMPFDAANVRQAARELAQKPFVVPDTSLPDNIKNLDYDKYRKIRFIPN